MVRLPVVADIDAAGREGFGPVLRWGLRGKNAAANQSKIAKTRVDVASDTEKRLRPTH